jgi:simple sugar transport system permease protein
MKRRLQKSRSKWGLQLVSSALAIVMALVLGGVAIAIAGANPIEAYKLMFAGAFGSQYAISETLLRTTPILIVGVGLAISFRCNLTNIGALGQIIFGALAATIVGLTVPAASPVLVISLSILAGFAGGALYAAIPGVLKAKFGTSEILVTIMLNYVAIILLSYLLDGPLREAESFYPQSALLTKAIWLPKVIAGTRLHIGFVLAVLCVIGYYLLMFRLPLGFRIRAVGFNARAAEYAGIKVGLSIVIAMMLSGGLAGVAGSSEILGVHHRLFNDFAGDAGFVGIAVALLARLHPIGLVLSAVFFAGLEVGSKTMQRAVQVPTTIVYVIQGLLLLFVFADKLIKDGLVAIGKRIKGDARQKED